MRSSGSMSRVEQSSALNRRAAVGAGLASLALMPAVALADDNEDAMAKIAAKSMQKLADDKAKERAKVERRIAKGKTIAQEEKEQKQGAQTAVLAVGGGGTLLSALFFQENLKRLFIKISSGGERSGYDEIPVKGAPKGRGRGKKPEPVQEQSFASKLAQAAFGRKMF